MGGIVKAVTSVISGIFGGNDTPAAPPAPVVAPVTPMPTADDAAVQDAKRKSIASITARQGRASTILSGTDDGKLGA